MGNARLFKEYQRFVKDPPPFITAKVGFPVRVLLQPRESDILEWHYLISGPPDTVYSGGEYHGVLIFPKEYPFKPPGIKMITPNGTENSPSTQVEGDSQSIREFALAYPTTILIHGIQHGYSMA